MSTAQSPQPCGFVEPEILVHLLDGRPVRVPYLTVGHHRRDDPAASPVVAQLLSSSTAGHPYNGKPLARVQLDSGKILVLAVDRMAHEALCDTCAPLWAHLEEILDQVPAGSSISAGVEIGTADGIALLVVDAEDLGSFVLGAERRRRLRRCVLHTARRAGRRR